MGRSLLIEETCQDSINNLLNSQKFQVGLILGQLSENKDYALHLAKCPDPVDDVAEVEELSADSDDCGEQNLKKKRKKLGTQAHDDIDSKWIIEHSRQVNRMLPGGVFVIGIYVCSAPENLIKNQAKLSSCLQSIHKRVERNKYVRCGMFHSHRYLIHICLHTKKITTKTIDLQEEQGSLHPSENRFQSFLSNWNHVSTCVDVNVQLVVPESQEASNAEKNILYASQYELEDIMNSFATVGSKLIDSNKVINENTKTKKGKVDNRELQITLFKQLNSGGRKDHLKYNKASVYVKFVGSISAKAFVNSKATYGDAVKALKLDIIRSVLTRVELLCEEAEVNNMSRVEEWSLMSPTRVFAPFRKSNIYFCDYIFKDESADDTLGRYSELLDITVHKSELLYPERSPEISEVSMILHGENMADQQSDVASELSSLSTHDEPQDKRIFAAVLAGLAAFTAGVIHLIWRE